MDWKLDQEGLPTPIRRHEGFQGPILVHTHLAAQTSISARSTALSRGDGIVQWKREGSIQGGDEEEVNDGQGEGDGEEYGEKLMECHGVEGAAFKIAMKKHVR